MKDLVAFDDIVDSRGVGSRGLPQSQWSEVGDLPVIGQGEEFSEGRTNRIDLAIVPIPALIVYGGHSMRAKFVTEKFVPGPNVKILIPDDRLDCKFLYYFLLKSPVKSKGYADHFPEVRKLEIPLPTLAEQKRIVALLDEAFACIDEVKAKAEANIENIQAAFARQLKCIFENKPGDWSMRKIGEVCVLKSGITVPANIEKSHGDIPYLKVADMNIPENKNSVTTSSRFLDNSDIKSTNLIPKGSIIFPKRGGAILTNKKRLTTLDVCADLNIMAAIPSGSLDSLFLYFYFLGVDMRKLGGGSSVPQINNYDIAPLLISFPEKLEVQREVACHLADIQKTAQFLAKLFKQKSERMDDLKSSLLARAFAGELNS